MKKTFKVYLFINILFIGGFPFSFGQVQHIVTFKRNEISLSVITAKDGSDYCNIKMPNTQQSAEVGKPELPVKYVRLIIPTGKDVSEVVLNSLTKESLLLSNKIIPVQPAVPISMNYSEQGFVKPDSSIYNSDKVYPTEIVKVVHQGYFDGTKRIVTLAVTPFQYYPKPDSLEFYTTIDFTLNLKDSKDDGIIVKNRSIKNTLMYNEILKSIVDNPEDISKYEIKSAEKGLGFTGKGDSFPYFEYIIITNNTLAPDFGRFIYWKRRKGIDIGIVTLDYIYGNYSGDLISGIYDNAGKIRQFLSDAYSNGTVFTLLAGDHTTVPIRYGWGSNNYDNENYVIPADLYFSDFTGDWKVDSDNRYGEPGDDNVDYNPEIYVGRLLCSNTPEIENWTEKLLKYEQNPGNGDYSYLTKAFFTQADEMQAGDKAGMVAGHLTTFTTTIWEEEPGHNTPTTPTFPKGTQVISEMNNHYGLYSLMGHGGPTNIAVATKWHNENDPVSKYKVTAFDNGPSGCCIIEETGNGFDNLTNSNYPSIFYSISCENMPFDDYNHDASVKNLAESYTMYNSGGGPAYLGNTRYGYVYSSSVMFNKFADLISNGTTYNLGIAEGISKQNYPSHYICLSHNLAGCPETEIWTAIPSQYTNVSVTENGSSVTVNTSGVSGSTICVMSILDNGESYHEVEPDVSSHTFINVVKPYYVTITKHNYIPYIYPTDIYIQNKTITNDSYISAENIYAGSEVTASEPYGPVIITNGAKVTLDAKQNVYLEGAFEVELGGTFEIK